jgi:metal-responsive CopG/Arc/MetJ family transcriptional regulator
MSEELLGEVNSQLEYGDNRSEWVRDAIKMKLAVLEEVDDLDEDMTDEERREFVVKAVRAAVEEE